MRDRRAQAWLKDMGNQDRGSLARISHTGARSCSTSQATTAVAKLHASHSTFGRIFVLRGPRIALAASGLLLSWPVAGLLAALRTCASHHDDDAIIRDRCEKCGLAGLMRLRG
jgi:hypothetical protein